MLALALALVGASCSTSDTGPDGGPIRIDGSRDADGDGLCDETERLSGLDPLEPDADADGLPDGLEWLMGSDPLDGASPDRRRIAFLEEGLGNAVQVPLEVVLVADDEDLEGAFVDGARGLYGDTTSAASFFASLTATFAQPAANARDIDAARARHRGVAGRTLLGYEMRFTYALAGVAACVRVYPYGFDVKSADGTRRFSEIRWLASVPPGGGLEGPWCPPAGGCL